MKRPVASSAMGHWGTCPLDFQQFHFSSLWSKSDCQLSKYCVACEISWCRCQQLTALSISTTLVTKLLVIKQLLHPAWSLPWVPHDIISSFAPPRNKSWRRHWKRLTKSLVIKLCSINSKEFTPPPPPATVPLDSPLHCTQPQQQ